MLPFHRNKSFQNTPSPLHVATYSFRRGFFKVCTKYVLQEKARQKKTALSFDNFYHALTVRACFDCGKQNQNLPRECKKLSFPPRFSLFRALRYALVGVGKKRKQTFCSVFHSNKHYRSMLNMSQIV